MFNPLRNLLSFWGAADTSVTESSSNTHDKDVTSESNGSTSNALGRELQSGLAYRAACNHAAPPTRYASGVFKTSPSPTPNAALSGYLFSQMKTSDSTTTSGDIDMPDAMPLTPLTPPITPPRNHDDTQRSAEETSQGDFHNATVEDDDETTQSRNNATPTPPECDDRPRSQPTQQQNHQHNTTTSPSASNWVDEIVIEEDTLENNLPVGYMGTFHGSRHFIPDYPGIKPCSNQLKHLLLCGHWIDSTNPCGDNCKKQDHSHKQFNCPACHDIVRRILTGAFQPVDSMRLREFRNKKDVAFLACCVEQVIRAAPQLKTGVTEAVAGFLYPGYGRACERAENPDPEGHDTIEYLVRDLQKRHERKQRERSVPDDLLHTQKKRARDEDATGWPTDANTPTNDDTATNHTHPRADAPTSDGKTYDTPPHTNKKRKTSLETHREPITPSTRGLKHRSSFPPSPSSSPSPSPSFTSPTASPFAYIPNSKTSCPSIPSPPPKKKLITKPDPAFGEASFVVTPPHVVGPLMRKRHSGVYVEEEIERESKRRRGGVWGVERKREKEGEMNGGRTRVKVFETFRRAWDERDEEEDCEL
ncbi:hypothetical protein J4E91_006288 [Alternaria rosae]|nr:hypothetical protein J4E91_006288 [Alternaria rosae]